VSSLPDACRNNRAITAAGPTHCVRGLFTRGTMATIEPVLMASTGSPSQRIDQLSTIIYNAQRMSEVTRGEAASVSDDSIPVELTPAVWDQHRMIVPPC